jgi:uncharacterized membrane protein
MSLIPADETFLLWGIVVGLVGFGFWSEKNTRIGRHLTGIVTAMCVTMLLSNLKIIPFTSPVYDSIFESILPMAIPLALFRADVVEAFRTGGQTVVAFCFGVVGVLLGCLVAVGVMSLGDSEAAAAGMYAATYIGGSANLSAVAIATDFKDGTLLTAIVAADVVASNLHVMFIVSLPGLVLVQRFFSRNRPSSNAPDPACSKETSPKVVQFDLAGVALAISTALILVYAGFFTAQLMGKNSLGIVFTTIYALVVSNFMKPLVRKMSCDFELGMLMIFLFLVAIAAESDVGTLLQSGVIFFFFAMIIITVHTIFLLVASQAFGLDLRNAIIGSTACIGGITTAAAIATAKGWRDLIIPGILAGTLGNSFGTLLGVLVWTVFS